jgi:NAD(P) transhydrogenase subunit alpha
VLQIGVPREIATGERRVALIPESLEGVVAAGGEVTIERGAGVEAGFLDEAYENAGARIADSAAEVLGGSDLVLKVQPPRMRESGKHEIDDMREGAALISFLQPLNETERVERLAKRRLSAFSMELMPRITRAQSMDALSSQSTIAGYRAVLLAAAALPRIFPMLVTAAGTLKPAKLLPGSRARSSTRNSAWSWASTWPRPTW